MAFSSTIEANIRTCESVIGYNFNDKLNCAKALSAYRGGHAIQGAFRVLARNDRMAVYGDAVAGNYLCRKWFETDLSKSTMTPPSDISPRAIRRDGR